jgi:putative transposase
VGIRSIGTRQSRISLIEQTAKSEPKISKVRLCQLFDIPRSTLYALKKPKLPSLAQINLRTWVKQAFDASKGSAGARNIAMIVSQQHSIRWLCVSRFLVAIQIKKYNYIKKLIEVY